MIDPGLALLVALAGAVLFGSAALHKLRAMAVFEGTLAEYRVMPLAGVRPAALVVVAIECALPFGLLWAPTRVAAAVAGAALLLVYAGAIGLNLRRGRRDIDCGCTFQHRPIGGWMVVRNSLLAAALLVLTLPTGERPLGWADGATILAALLVATILYASADLLLGRPALRQGYTMDSP